MRVGIVNDLALAREVLRRLVQSTPEHTVAWLAENGEEAVRRASQDCPDVILMDLVMPVMDGVEATRRIMSENPCPILLVTSSVTGNFNLVYQAMGHGGLDAVNTPTLAADGAVHDGEGLLARMAKLAQANRLPAAVPGNGSKTAHPFSGNRAAASVSRLPPLLVLGSSTGGPEALAQVLGGLPKGLPATVICIQHIAADFAPSLANWLQSRTPFSVKIAVAGSEPKLGEVVLAATNDHLILTPERRFAYIVEPKDYPYRPSVDVLFESVAHHWPRSGVAALLTGMGSDGARGLLRLRHAGWFTIAQDQATSVVYGMPKAAADLQAAFEILPLSRIAASISSKIACHNR